MKSRDLFAEAFMKALREDSTATGALGGSTGGFNPEGGSISSSDFYAPGDARIPKGGRVIQTRRGAIKRRKKKKR